MSITVTATQGGSTSNGLLLRIFVLTGAKAANLQSGATAAANITSSTAFTVAGTIQQASSHVYGAAVNGSNSSFSGSGTTVVDNVADGTNGERYGTFKQNAPSTGSQTLGMTAAGAATGGVAWLEVLANTGNTLTEDPSAPAVASTTSATTVTSAAFNPPPGALVVALVSSDGGATVTTMTVSGGGLSWTEKIKENASAFDYCGVWIAQMPPQARYYGFPAAARRRVLPDAASGYAAGALPGGLNAQIAPSPQGFVSTANAGAAAGFATRQVCASYGAPVPSSGPAPTAGPVFHPAVQAIRARYLPQSPLAGVAFAELAAGTGNIAGPVNGAGFGHGTGANGALVRNPTQGPVFRPFTQEVRAAFAQQPVLRGRCYSSPGAPVRNPSPGPAFRQKPVPVRYVLPPWQPRAGRIGSAPGAPVINPLRGPPVYAPQGPVKAKRPLLPRAGKGTASFRSGAPVRNPAAGPAFTPAVQPARIRRRCRRAGAQPATRAPPLPPRLSPGLRSARPPSLRVPASPRTALAAGLKPVPAPRSATRTSSRFPARCRARSTLPCPPLLVAVLPSGLL